MSLLDRPPQNRIVRFLPLSHRKRMCRCIFTNRVIRMSYYSCPSSAPNLTVTLQVWRYEGAKTLSAYLRRRDCVSALARDLGVPAEAVAATVLRHILEGLTVRTNLLQKIYSCTAKMLFKLANLHKTVISKSLQSAFTDLFCTTYIAESDLLTSACEALPEDCHFAQARTSRPTWAV